MAKKRLDQLLVERGLAESRTRAQALIMAGKVTVAGRSVDKAGQAVPEDAELALKGADHPWVSRGGLKLDHALSHFGLDVTGLVAMDVGSSTGGFTDVLLARGAARVHAVDSGTNQLAWKLRQDPRVIVHEQTSARILSASHIPEPIDIVTCDASFIGLAKVLVRPLDFTGENALLVALVKPQFEAGRAEVGKGGVVRDPAVHARVCAQASDWIEAQPGWHVLGLVTSPITGPEGNVEFLIAARKGAGPAARPGPEAGAGPED
jgi:23S rRNA (cytidine1920-2'-O)/16S rRNA (cytidine1409-2'-O)-methyltransferase